MAYRKGEHVITINRHLTRAEFTNVEAAWGQRMDPWNDWSDQYVLTVPAANHPGGSWRACRMSTPHTVLNRSRVRHFTPTPIPPNTLNAPAAESESQWLPTKPERHATAKPLWPTPATTKRSRRIQSPPSFICWPT